METLDEVQGIENDIAVTVPPTRSLFGRGEAVIYSARSPDKHTPNEDVVAVLPYDQTSGLLIVADGLGGMPEGEEASRLAVDSIAEVVAEAAQTGLPLRDALLNGIEQANRRVLARGTGAATTLAAVEIAGNTIRPYHIGDSLILICGQRGRIKLQTVSHSPVGYAVEAGLLDEDEAVHHEQRHLVSNVIGGTDMRIEIGPTVELAPRDTVVLASDGLADNLYLNEIVEFARKGPLVAGANALSHLAHLRMTHARSDSPSHPDDLSFVLFRLR